MAAKFRGYKPQSPEQVQHSPALQQKFQQALTLHKRGMITQAQAMYEEVLKDNPNHFDALHLWGVCLYQAGQLEKAAEAISAAIKINSHYAPAFINHGIALTYLKRTDEALASYDKAISLKPDFAEAYYNRGNALRDLLRLHEAFVSYDKAISLKPDYADAHNNRGNALKDLKRLEEAIASYDTAISIKPDYAVAYNNRGIALKDLKRLDEALASYDRATSLKPDYADAYYNRGIALNDLRRLEEALASFDTAISLKPDYADAYYNRGIALKDLRRLDEALASYDKAIGLKPDYADAYNNRGVTLNDLRQLDEALANYDKAISLKPDYADAYYNRGIALKDLRRLGEAIASYDKAIGLKPDFAEAYNNRGNALKDLNRLHEALVSFDKAISLKPLYSEAYSNRGNVFMELGRLNEAQLSYENAISLKNDNLDALSNSLFCINYQSRTFDDTALAKAAQYGSMASIRAVPKLTNRSFETSRGSLRIGFVSGDFRNHPVGYFLEGMLEHIDPDKYELIAFANQNVEDELTARIKPSFREWHRIKGKADSEVAQFIQSTGIHCLIDLSGHTADNRLSVFAYKPAPLQLSWLGYFATTGVPEIDYILGDPYVTPLSEAGHFSEKVWQLPNSYLCFAPPREEVLVTSLPALTNKYVTFGSFNHLAKMTDAVVSLWARVLHAVPGSRLFLKTKQLADGNVVADVIERFSLYGVSRESLILEGPSRRSELLESYNKVDVALDPFPYPGGTTSAESLWMGVPVLTMKGNRFLSHVGESICHNVGHSSWIATCDDDYVAKAVALTAELEMLSDIRKKLRSSILQSPLFDGRLFARNFESAVSEMWNIQKTQMLS